MAKAVLSTIVMLAALLMAATSASAQDSFRCSLSRTSDTSVTLSWSAVSGATGYQYKLAVAGGNRYRVVTGTSVSVEVPAGSSPAASMAPRVPGQSVSRVACDDGGAAPAPATPTPAAPSPAAPAPVAPTPAAPPNAGSFSCSVSSVEGGIQLQWERVDGATGYQFRWTVDGGGNRYGRVEGNAKSSLLLPVDPGSTVTVQMAPRFGNRSQSRIACGSSAGGGAINPGVTGNPGVAGPPPVVDAPAAPSSTGTSTSSPIRSSGTLCDNRNDNDNFPGLAYGDFLLMSNAWNAKASSGDWNQCVSLIDRGGRTAAHWTYDWLAETDVIGPAWQVKSYPEVIYGTKSAFESSGTVAQTGLPAVYNDLPQFRIDYSFSSTEERTHSKVVDGRTVYGEKNVAIESFFHSSCDIQRGRSGSNRELEIMVWLESGPERNPDGASGLKTEATIGGQRYKVWTKGAKDPGYIAFQAIDERQSGSLDWSAFIEWTRTNGAKYGTRSFDDDWCMGNILFGTEIWWGAGSFTLERFDITRR